MKRMRSFFEFPCFPPELWSLNYPKKLFFKFCGKKSKSVKAIYIYASESFHYSLSGNDMVYRDITD